MGIRGQPETEETAERFGEIEMSGVLTYPGVTVTDDFMRQTIKPVKGTVPEIVDFEMRGGQHPDPEMNALGELLVREAYTRVLLNPAWMELGFKRAYNLLHMTTLYGTRDPSIIRLLYRVQPYPSYVEMEVTQKCPLRCIMCEHTYWDEGEDQLSLERFKYAMDQFPDLKWAGINALGDPFTNPEYGEMVKYLDEKAVCQELYLSSALLKEKDMRQFTERRGLVFLKFSFDAATKETYGKIRVGASFDQVVANIKAFDKYKRDAGKYWPELQFHYIVMKQNIHEAEQFLDFVDGLEINCANVMYSRLLHNYPEVKDVYEEIPDELLIRLKAKSQKLGIPVSFSQDIGATKPPASNCTSWLMPYIFSDGTVISCCCMNEQNRRGWQRVTRMGNVFEKRMREIWVDKPYVQLREKLRMKKPLEAHPVCRICNIYDPMR